MNKDNKDNKDNNPVEIPDVRTIRFFDDDDTEYKHPLIVAPFVSYKFIMETLDRVSDIFEHRAENDIFEHRAENQNEAYAINNGLNLVAAVIARKVVEHLTEVINKESERSLRNK